MDSLSNLLVKCVNISIYFFEWMGLVVMVTTGIKGILNYMYRRTFTRIHLAKGMALALEFKLGSEILRTVIARDLSEIIAVACIITLRAALSFLIHWEIKNDQDEECSHPISKS